MIANRRDSEQEGGRQAALTLRIPEDLRRELATIAFTQGTSIAEEIRTAIAEHLEAKRKDAGFRDRLRDMIKEHENFLAESET